MLLAVCCAALLLREARAYSGTVPIFPDVAAGKKQEAAKAYELQCKRRLVGAKAGVLSLSCSSNITTCDIQVRDRLKI